jgi:hypothetical protein
MVSNESISNVCKRIKELSEGTTKICVFSPVGLWLDTNDLVDLLAEKATEDVEVHFIFTEGRNKEDEVKVICKAGILILGGVKTYGFPPSDYDAAGFVIFYYGKKSRAIILENNFEGWTESSNKKIIKTLERGFKSLCQLSKKVTTLQQNK